jgi:hypothetical protein
MTGLTQFEQLCRETDFRYHDIVDDAARAAAQEKYETMWASYNALKLEVIASAPEVSKVDQAELRKISSVFLQYAPPGTGA